MRNAVVLNQFLQPRPALPQPSPAPAQIFPDAPDRTPNPLLTITTILSQALTTRDHSAVKQLLLTSNQEVISNTVGELELGRVGALLEAIEGVLLEERGPGVRVLADWLAHLLRRHIGMVVANAEMGEVVGRLAGLVRQRVKGLDRLQAINARLRYREQQGEKQQQWVPKFHYVEEENEHEQLEEGQEQANEQGEGEQQMGINMDDIADMDAMLMDDDMDMDI